MSSLGARLRVLTLVFLVTAVILAVNGRFLYNNVKDLESDQDWVTHTYQVIVELERVLSSVKDAETFQRGYLLTGDDKFSAGYQKSTEEAWLHFSSIKELVADNPEQTTSLDRLEKLMQERFALLSGNLSKFQKTKRVPETFGNGQDAMESLRREAKIVENRERQLLKSRSDSASSQRGFLVFTLIGSTILSILFALATYLMVRRQYLSQEAENSRRQREAWLKSAEADAAKIALLKGGVRPISEMLVGFICDQLNFLAANMYSEADGSLVMSAGYSTGEDGGSPSTRQRRQFKIGEALLGRAANLDTIQVIEDVPGDYFKVESSMGSKQPSFLIFAPVKFQNDRIGILEIASFAKPTADQLEWLNVVLRSVGAGLASARAQEKLQDLLEETQRQAEELQMQQEELRTTNEELEEQAKALLEAQGRSQMQTEELRQVNEELEQQTKTLEAQQDTLNLKNKALETSRRSLEDKARELERASAYKSEFMAKMSHELRTPLNSLMILATILQENKKGNLDDQQVEFARTIYEAGTDLLDLINDILDLSKIEAKKLQVKAEPLPVGQFLNQIAALFKPQAEARGLQLNVEVGQNVPPSIVTDRQRLQQILRNLIGNAMKFTEKGSLTLAARNVDGQVAISVRDTGIGIPPEKIKLIWEAFEQADGSISRRFGGTGLGLTISRELTQLLQGEITVESEPGKGSEFTLLLPVEMESAQAPHATPSAQPERPASAPVQEIAPARPQIQEDNEQIKKLLEGLEPTDRTILIVEDDEKFREAVKDAVLAHDFEPLAVGDSETALALLKHHVPKAILLDVRLPGISGLALLDIIKKNPALRHVPIHMISALERQHSALRMGAIGYLGKPVTIDGVRGALNRIESVIDRKVKRLLVVEDDARQRKLITDLLSGADVEITAVGTGADALTTLKANGADCVVLDLKLPDMSGFELLEDLNSQNAQSVPPVIVYTGKDLTREEEERLRHYSDSIIIKGAKSPERLLDEVSLFIHRVEADLPVDKRAMLSDVRGKDRSFDGRNILLVDDDLRNLFALTSALEAKGFRVTVARDGLEAIEKLDAMPETDVVLMDIMMPKMDGFEAMKRIREKPQHRALPIIALTAKAMAGEHERCVKAGASDYLPKPIDLSSLLSVLKVWLPSGGIMT